MAKLKIGLMKKTKFVATHFDFGWETQVSDRAFGPLGGQGAHRALGTFWV